jgi:hypothetical protein
MGFMSAGELIAVSIWVAGMVYTALCVGIPEIRMYWKGSDTKMGMVSCLGVAMFFWIPASVLLGESMGLILDAYKFAGFLLCVLGLVVAGVGYFIDIST